MKISRRQFLGLSAAGLVAACGGETSSTQTSTVTASPNPEPSVTSESQSTATSQPATAVATATPVPATATVAPPETLRAYADELKMVLGVLPNGRTLNMSPPDGPYRELLNGEFNLFGNGLGWPSSRPADSQGYTLARQYFEKTIGIAEQFHQRFRCNGIFWTPDVPSWLSNAGLSRDALLQVMQDRVSALFSYYRGRVEEWVVVNEALHVNGNVGIAGDFYAEAIGPEYVELAFTMARNADDKPLLIYNDYQNETGPGVERNAQQISSLKAKGLVDAIGLQMHVDATQPPTKEELIASMQRYSALGVQVLITEMDVNLRGVPGSTDQRFQRQAEIYGTVFEAALESGACKSITLQNPGDSSSWLETAPVPAFGGPTAQPTAWNDDFSPKPAYSAILHTLQQAAGH